MLTSLRRSLLRLLAIAGVLTSPGCSASHTTSRQASSESRQGPRRQAAGDDDANQGVPVWYERLLERDITGDGRTDSLFLRGYGRRGDSLGIVFAIVTGGREVFRTTWSSRAELIDPPLSPNPPRATVDSFMRARLDAFFTGLRMSPLDTSSFRALAPADCPRDVADCGAVVDDIRRNTKYQLTFS